MKTFKWFVLATLATALFSCSKNHSETLDNIAPLKSETRGEASQNDSTEGGGTSGTINEWDTVTDSIVADETPKDEVKSDTIPNDSIPKKIMF